MPCFFAGAHIINTVVYANKVFDFEKGLFMHKALYRKWRPETFSDVCGQEHITTVLTYEVEHEMLSHAYLFCGSRGTGKTSCAKILAKAVNCENPQGGNPCGHCRSCNDIESGAVTDVVEMDAASNNGVDDIRGIRDDVLYLPSSVKYRVYIIDEVHMLSTSAFNALLKTLEEPPAHAIFILATTEQHKIPATIVSRCQRFDFRRLSVKTIVDRLDYIASNEGYELDTDAAQLIASLSQGGMRDAISMLELAAGMSLNADLGQLRSHITEESVLNVSGMTGKRTVAKLINAVLDSDIEAIFDITEKLYNSSRDISVFWRELIDFYRDMLIIKTTKKAQKYLDLTDNEMELTSQVASRFRASALMNHISLLDKAYVDMQRGGTSKRSCAEFALVKMTDPSYGIGTDALIDRIALLESKLEDITRMLNIGCFSTDSVTSRDAKGDFSDLKTNNKEQENSKEGKSVGDISNVSEAGGLKITSKFSSQDGNNSVPGRSSHGGGRRVLYSLPFWDDVINEYIKYDVSMSEILRMSTGYRTDGGCMIVKAESGFVASMLGDLTVRNRLLSIVAARDSRITDVKIEVKSVENEKDLFDEIEQTDKNAD